MSKLVLCSILVFISTCCATAHQLDFFGKCNKVPLPNCTASWNAITSNDTALYVVGNNGICFISYHNGGVKSINTGTTNNLTGVQFLNNSNGFAWGEHGTLLKTINGGISWTAIFTDTTKAIDKVQFIDVDHGFFMVGHSISKTIDGGVTWTNIALPATVPITDYYFFDSLNGQICGGTLSPLALGYVYKTNNGGLTWNQIYIDNIYFKKLFYINDSAGYVYGINNTNAILLKTANKGVAWNTSYSNTSWTLGSNIIHFSDTATFVSNQTGGSYIYGTPDFGTPDGISSGAKYVYSLKYNGIKMLYILSSTGLYRYINEGIIYFNCDFYTGINPAAFNPSNSLIPGSKVKFKVSIYNVFSAPLINLTAKIKCTSPYIKITDSLGSYSTVASHAFAWNKDEFEIQLANNTPNNYVPQFELMIGDPLQIGGTWNSIFSFPIIFAPFTIGNAIVDDDNITNSKGNNDKIAEPSEIVEMAVFTDNITQHVFSEMDGQLVSNRNEIHIWNDTLGVIDTVRNHYYYGGFSAMGYNIQGVEKFVFTDNFRGTTKINFSMIFTGKLNTFHADDNGCNFTEYNNILFRWNIPFSINDSYPEPLSVKELKSNLTSEFSLYPNPNTGMFILKLKNKNGLFEKIKLVVIDAIGKEVYQSNLDKFTDTFIDITEQTAGVYYLKITTDKGSETMKIVKL